MTDQSMALFNHLSIGISIVLGLGATLLLTSLLAAFRERKRVRLDWIPFVWAGYVLLFQIQFWWASWGFASVEDWTVLSFVVPLIQAVAMFIAAGLVLPSGAEEYPESLEEYFERDGKWGVAALAVRSMIAMPSNAIFFGAPLVNPQHFLMLVQVVLALVCVFTGSRRTRVVATVLFGLILTMTVLMATPFSFPVAAS